jgi:hypothetical protein
MNNDYRRRFQVFHTQVEPRLIKSHLHFERAFIFSVK